MAANVFLSSSSSANRWIYDVFLSFRGEDTGKAFTDHLYQALKDAGINTFRDQNALRKGEDITSELVKAIQGSRISVIVFSRNYADSRWCLEELVKITECRKNFGQSVLPVFYDVDPSDMRHQKGSFGEAFENHEKRFVLQMDKVERWKAALVEVADLSGWNLKNAADGYEAKFIKKLVRDISKSLNYHTSSFEISHPVGLDSRVLKMTSLLKIESDDVRMVGICGMGGIGKTTIAKAIFNQLFQSFEVRSFIANVREIREDQLQERLLSDILMTTRKRIRDVDRISMIKRKLSQKRVLLILDDVDELDKLNAVAGSRAWFGSGSRIIITTRDQDILKPPTVDEIYMAKEMDIIESLKFFCLHAFGKSHPKDDYANLAKDIVVYSGGLPLALKVLGSFLSNKSILEWESTLEKLRNVPDNKIQKALRISYDSLRDDTEKNIFLDISCFFIGMDADYVVQILNGCHFYAIIGLRVLIERCLLTIDDSNKLGMHDLIRDMGREIVRERSLNVPGRCSRLWRHEDVIDVLTNKTGTRAVEGLTLKLPEGNDVRIDTKGFSKLQKLRLLQLHHVQLDRGPENFSKELRWLCWHGFPMEFIPKNIYQGNLVAIDMRHSNLRHVWKDSQVLEKLKFLNLSHSHFLVQTPDFSKLPILEELELKDCKGLVEVHPSIGDLKKLILVNLEDCISLKHLPREFWKLKSLKTLILSGCPVFNKFPKDLQESESLSIHHADNTVPSAVELLSPLQDFTCLKELYLRDCNLLDDTFPKDLGSLSSLTKLDLEGNSFLSLPAGISGLSSLTHLVLSNCTRLQTIPELPKNLVSLKAKNCKILEELPVNLFEFPKLALISLTNSHKLDEGQSNLMLVRPTVIDIKQRVDLSDVNELLGSSMQAWLLFGLGGVILPGNELPFWVRHKKQGSSIQFRVPEFSEGTDSFFLTLFCAVSLAPVECHEPYIILINWTKSYEMGITSSMGQASGQGDHVWRADIKNVDVDVDSKDLLQIDVRFGPQNIVKEIGVFASLLFRAKERLC